MPTPVKPLILHAHEIRRLLAHGSVLVLRPVKPQPQPEYRLWGPVFDGYAAWTDHPIQGEKGHIIEMRCPLGTPGTKNWVRETWRRSLLSVPNGLEYRADGLLRWFDGSDTVAEYASVTIPRDGRWRSPVTMQRWASRCDVTVRDVRVMRIWSLQYDDNLAQGFDWRDEDGPCQWFMEDWNARHGKQYPYAANPHAWAVTIAHTPASPAEEE